MNKSPRTNEERLKEAREEIRKNVIEVLGPCKRFMATNKLFLRLAHSKYRYNSTTKSDRYYYDLPSDVLGGKMNKICKKLQITESEFQEMIEENQLRMDKIIYQMAKTQPIEIPHEAAIEMAFIAGVLIKR